LTTYDGHSCGKLEGECVWADIFSFRADDIAKANEIISPTLSGGYLRHEFKLTLWKFAEASACVFDS
jgi:hypothetical protein